MSKRGRSSERSSSSSSVSSRTRSKTDLASLESTFDDDSVEIIAEITEKAADNRNSYERYLKPCQVTVNRINNDVIKELAKNKPCRIPIKKKPQVNRPKEMKKTTNSSGLTIRIRAGGLGVKSIPVNLKKYRRPSQLGPKISWLKRHKQDFWGASQEEVNRANQHYLKLMKKLDGKEATEAQTGITTHKPKQLPWPTKSTNEVNKTVLIPVTKRSKKESREEVKVVGKSMPSLLEEEFSTSEDSEDISLKMKSKIVKKLTTRGSTAKKYRTDEGSKNESGENIKTVGTNMSLSITKKTPAFDSCRSSEDSDDVPLKVKSKILKKLPARASTSKKCRTDEGSKNESEENIKAVVTNMSLSITKKSPSFDSCRSSEDSDDVPLKVKSKIVKKLPARASTSKKCRTDEGSKNESEENIKAVGTNMSLSITKKSPSFDSCRSSEDSDDVPLKAKSKIVKKLPTRASTTHKCRTNKVLKKKFEENINEVGINTTSLVKNRSLAFDSWRSLGNSYHPQLKMKAKPAKEMSTRGSSIKPKGFVFGVLSESPKNKDLSESSEDDVPSDKLPSF